MKGLGGTQIDLDRGTQGYSAEPWVIHMVHGRARVHRKDDEHGVHQVEWENNGKSSKHPMQWECERFEGVKARWDVRHVSTLGLFDCFVLKPGVESGVQEVLVIWASKSPMRIVSYFGPQNKGQSWCGQVCGMEGMCHHYGACFEAKGCYESGDR